MTEAGFPDGRAQARELMQAARGDDDVLRSWLKRRVEGEPLSWLTGVTTFCGHTIRIDRGVYVPRYETEAIARRAIQRLPDGGLAADLATGSGAVAVALSRARPAARVVATDLDDDACRCARANGVEVYQGNLGAPIPTELSGGFDVVVAVVPYVPTDELVYLPRDIRRYEPRGALDGGVRGLELLQGAVRWAAVLLRRNATLILELGGEQDAHLEPALADAGFGPVDRIVDEDGDLRGIEAVRT